MRVSMCGALTVRCLPCGAACALIQPGVRSGDTAAKFTLMIAGWENDHKKIYVYIYNNNNHTRVPGTLRTHARATSADAVPARTEEPQREPRRSDGREVRGSV